MLIDARGSKVVKLLEFIKLSDDSKTVIFFEGEDEKYYSVRINSICPDLQWNAITADGKSNVLALRDSIKNRTEYAGRKCLFFVDADFDDNSAILNQEDIYVTPCYSIENLYVSGAVLARVLSAEFKLSPLDGDVAIRDKIIYEFSRVSEEFNAKILSFNAWIRAYRKNSLTQELPKLNINNVSFEKLFDIRLDSANQIYDDRKISELFPVHVDPESSHLAESLTHFSTLENSLWFRGKQQLDFFVAYLRKLQLDSNSRTAGYFFPERKKCTLSLTGNALSELSQYASTPDCLHAFIRNACVAHCSV
jgi:hypothetical protein